MIVKKDTIEKQTLENEQLITKLLNIEAWAKGLLDETRQVRQILEGVSTPSARKGIDEISKSIVTKRWQKKLSKKTNHFTNDEKKEAKKI